MTTTTLCVSAGGSLELAARPLDAQRPLPMCITPKQAGLTLRVAAAAVQAHAARHLHEVGALLLRGFEVDGVDAFRAFAESFGAPLLSYEFGSTPRSKISQGVYSSTEYPAHQSIPLHNEQSYSLHWPMKIWFYCAQPSPVGGETPIADSREVFCRVPARIRQRFSERGLMYVRNYGGGLDVPWQQVFDTSDRAAVEAYCRAHQIVCEWKDDGELRTRQVCQAVAQHPRTREWVWFNQAHLFHVSGLSSELRDVLRDLVEPEDLPRNVYYGDGRPLEDDLLDEVRGVLDEVRVAFRWQADDILMLDNMLVAHARAPFEGPRKIVVAMAEPHHEADASVC